MAGRGPIRWLSRLPGREPRADDSVTWEIEHHVSELVDRLVAEGWEEDAARVEAERRFGDRHRYGRPMKRLERGRWAMERRNRAWDFMRESVTSVHKALRRYPGFSAGVIATLALGIGANATMYGVVDRLLLQPPMHVADHEQVRRVVGQRPSFITGEPITQAAITYPDYADLKAHSGFASVAAFSFNGEATIGSGEDATRARFQSVTSEFFPLLGVRPVIGRFFTPEEAAPGAPLTAVITEEYWERAYGRDPEVLGRDVEVDGRRHTIIGVTPEGFTGVDLEAVDLWLPLEATHVAEEPESTCLESRGCWWLMAVARLADGTSVEAAEAEATQLHLNGRRDQVERGRYSEEARMLLTPLIAAEGPEASAETRVAGWLTGVSLIVLLIACANVANLLLARSTRGRREVAVRLALGASRGRLVGQITAQTVLLAFLGGGVGLLVARWGGGYVRSALLPGVYFPDSAINGRVIAFTVVASLVAGVIAGLVPAIQGSRVDLAGDIGDARGASSGRSRLRGALTVFQAAMSVVLLVGAGLFVRSLGELRSLDLGIDTDRVILAMIELRSSHPGLDERTAVYEEAIRAVTALPEVESAAATGVPFQWGYAIRLRVPGLDSIPTLDGGGPYYFPVTAGYFETVGLRVLRGRPILPSDGPGDEKVVVVSETMARTLWPEGDALGECVLVGTGAEECTSVVGVVEDAARGGYRDRPFMAYYLPMAQDDRGPYGLYVRTRGDATRAVSAVAPLLRSFSPEVRYTTTRSMQEILDPQARSWTLGAAMFSVFGALAMVLAAIGLYGVLAFDVTQRTRELGIRTALGAERVRLLRSVLAQGTRMAGLGVLVGLGVAWGAAPYAADLLFEVSPRDPAVLGSVAALLVAVSVAASLSPGLRATRVDPVEALKSE